MNCTDQELVDNIHDPNWRIRNLYKIKNKDAETIPFVLNETQESLQNANTRFNMSLKGRQQGVSTYYLIKYLDRVMWNENQTVGIISHDQKSIEKLFRIPKFVYENMPEHLKPRLDRGGGSKYMLYFPDLNSRIYVDLEIRSESLTALHISEYGLMLNKDRFTGSVEAINVATGEISIESTCMGMNHFYDDWIDPNFPYGKHFFAWFMHKENKIEVNFEIEYTEKEIKFIKTVKEKYKIDITPDQINWRRFKIQQAESFNKFLQEHPEDDIRCFLVSGNPVLDLVFINDLIKKAPKPVKVIDGIKIFKEINNQGQYVIGADTAEGVGSDYSVGTVIDKKTLEQVAQLRGHLSPYDFAHKLKQLASLYTTKEEAVNGMTVTEPLLGVERNNHGHAVLQELEQHIKYGNLYEHRDGRAGWVTDKVSRPIMVDTFLQAVQNQTYKINDEDTWAECLTLVEKNGKIQAADKKHDDCIIASAIAIQMTQVTPIEIIPSLGLL